MFEPYDVDFDFELPVNAANPPVVPPPGEGENIEAPQELPSDINHKLTRKANLRKSARMKSDVTFSSVGVYMCAYMYNGTSK